MHVRLIVRKGQGLTEINDWVGLAYVTKEKTIILPKTLNIYIVETFSMILITCI